MLDVPTAPAAADRDRRAEVEVFVREFFALRAKGDAPALVSRLAPDFIYRSRGAWPMWPYHGGPIPRAQFVEAVGRANAEIQFLGSEFHEFLVDGDAAAVHATCGARNRGAGPPVEFDLWMFLRFREALIFEAAIYVDVARAAGLLPAGLVEVQSVYSPGTESRADKRSPAQTQTGRRYGSTKDAGPVRETAEAESATDGSRNRALMERVALDFFALRKKGDVAAMLGRLAPDFIHNPRGDWTKPPFMPGLCDRATFAAALRLVNVEFEDLGGEIHELLVDGDEVAAHRTVRLRNRGSGGIVRVDEWIRFRVSAGLIVELASYVDSAMIARVEWPPYAPPR
jgi:ketosteroid isomerase-like protein